MPWTSSQYNEYEMRRRVRNPADNADLSPATVPLESDLHGEILRFCDGQWPRWKAVHARMDKKSTLPVGCQDFTIFADGGRVFCLECKARHEKPTAEQLVWHKEMEMLGHAVHVVRSMAEFLHCVQPQGDKGARR